MCIQTLANINVCTNHGNINVCTNTNVKQIMVI